MTRRYLAFDIETAKEVPGTDFNWKPHRPLGISCIASLASDTNEPRVWLSRDNDGAPAKQMSREDVAAFVRLLKASALEGQTILSWNGLSFDFDILAEESGLTDECRQLARNHVDMMFHVVCEKGFPVSLQNAAAGLELPGKLADVAGVDAPVLWNRGEHEKVMEYVGQDVRTTLAVAETAERQHSLKWNTRKGTTASLPLPNGWLTVDEALKLPLPDTSWMHRPLSRDSFASWLNPQPRGKGS